VVSRWADIILWLGPPIYGGRRHGGDQHFIDTTAIHVHHLKAPPAPFKMVRRRGDVPQLQYNETGHGLIQAFLLARKRAGPKKIFELIHRHHPINQPGAVFTLDRGGLSGLPSL
jgi:hypothetical protein